MSKASVCRSIENISTALKNNASQYIKWPTVQEQQSIKDGCYSISGFPNVVGAVNGTQIIIRAPSNNENHYVCRKGHHSLNVQIICDHRLVIANVVAKWPGSTHDAGIWANCTVGEEGGFHGGWLLGDSGYPLSHYLLTPIYTPTSTAEGKYKASHARARQVIEQCIGSLKMRFRVLHTSGSALQYLPEKCVKIIISACLHNIAQQSNMPIEDAEDDQPEAYELQNTAGHQVHDALIEKDLLQFYAGPNTYYISLK
ncbi:putative nuclease HARBI1 [Huso huso]|uniref:Putative nuclease HARBI1 n=1 Tax=Huso huso TaxID=61971 RepID=A0ABR0YVG6_HUSHU